MTALEKPLATTTPEMAVDSELSSGPTKSPEYDFVNLSRSITRDPFVAVMGESEKFTGPMLFVEPLREIIRSFNVEGCLFY